LALLLKHKQYNDAANGWTRYLAGRRDSRRKSNYLLNPNFRFPRAESPFDWRISPVAGADLSIEGDSLVIRFNGQENVDFHHVAQQVIVSPGRWRVRALIRTEGLTTDEGIRLHAFDPECAVRLDVASDSISGSADVSLTLDFRVAAPTQLVEVQFARRSSLKYDSKISGRVVVRSVLLERIS
jgi:hypothetical protein